MSTGHRRKIAGRADQLMTEARRRFTGGFAPQTLLTGFCSCRRKALGSFDMRDHEAGQRHLDTPERLQLYYARSALSARAAAATSRLGTDKPSELAGALCRLSPAAHANRAKLLDGVRLLPLGRFYAGNKDVYPEIVDSWREISKSSAVSAPVGPALPSGA